MRDREEAIHLARRCLAQHLRSDALFGIEELPVTERSYQRPADPLARPARPALAPGAPGRPASPGGFVPKVPNLTHLLGSPEKRAQLDILDDEVRSCRRCGLHARRTIGVPGEGNVDADLMFIGEGPGAEEDTSGRPFVGRAGELLSKIIVAMGFSRETVFIANIVKCRPPGNRDPLPAEVAACFPYLERQIAIIEPRVICTLGLPATRTLLKISGGIGAVRGKKFQFAGIPLVPTFHPAYLLRNPAGKASVWQDVQYIARLVAESGGTIPDPEALRRASGGKAAGGQDS